MTVGIAWLNPQTEKWELFADRQYCYEELEGANRYGVCDSKIMTRHTTAIMGAGTNADMYMELFLKDRSNSIKELHAKRDNEYVIIHDGTMIYYCDGKAAPLRNCKVVYIGGGAVTAKTAMMCGKTPKEAIRIASMHEGIGYGIAHAYRKGRGWKIDYEH